MGRERWTAIDFPMKAGSAQWSWKCPNCGAKILARRGVSEEASERLKGTLLEFEHVDPICSEFDDGHNLEAVIEAWKKGEFVDDGPGNGVS